MITLCSTGKTVWWLCFCFSFLLFTCQVAKGAENWLKIIASQCNYTSSVGFYRTGVRPITFRYTFFTGQQNEQLLMHTESYYTLLSVCELHKFPDRPGSAMSDTRVLNMQNVLFCLNLATDKSAFRL